MPTAEQMTTTGQTVVYAYGIVPAGFDTRGAPGGLDDSPVELVRAGDYAALASILPAAEYSADAVERQSGEVHWLSPRAMAHDRVLTWAQEHGGVLPMPMFSLWAGRDALTESLADRKPELARVFERVRGADEFGLRVHRRDADMIARAHELDPQIAELKTAAERAAPGQKYLLERKLGEQAKAAARVASQRMAKDVFESLRALSREALARPLTPSSSATADATMVLNGAFLVDRGRLDEFRAAVAARISENEPRGLSFDFTGPWPPYNFSA